MTIFRFGWDGSSGRFAGSRIWNCAPFWRFSRFWETVRIELLLQQVVVRLFLVFVIADQGDHLLFPSRGLLDLPLHGCDAFQDLRPLPRQGSDFRHGGLQLGMGAADFIAPWQGRRGDQGIRVRIPGREGGGVPPGLREPLFQIRHLPLRADDFRKLLGIPCVQIRQFRLRRRQFDPEGLDRIQGKRRARSPAPGRRGWRANFRSG